MTTKEERMALSPYLNILLPFLSGFGIFLYGIYLLGETLQTLAGAKLKSWLEKATDSPYKGAVIGTVLTAILHSSSGTTALTISLVRAGLMTFSSSIGIILGANIGTTFTSLLTGLNIALLAPLMLIGSALIIFLTKSERTKQLAKVFFGFSLLFIGMELIDQGLSQVAGSDRFQSLLLSFTDRPYVSLLVGTVLTALIQSSTLAIGILQTVYANGLIDFRSALPLIFGSNIGTTISLEIFAATGSVEAKRTALFQVLFNALGALLFMILFNPFYGLMLHLIETFSLSPKMSIAIAHFLFNLLTALMAIGFTREMERFMKRLIP